MSAFFFFSPRLAAADGSEPRFMKEAEEEEEESSEEEEELSPEEQGKHRYLTFYASSFTCTSPFIYQLSVERFALNRMTSHHSFNIEQRA